MDTDPISVEDKRQTLERVLESRTFARSDQLRAFLRYVCEAEFEGRARQLNEYVLGGDRHDEVDYLVYASTEVADWLAIRGWAIIRTQSRTQSRTGTSDEVRTRR
jgi:hypothetical protein